MNLLANLRRRFLREGFSLPSDPFGVGDSERCIEVPWALSCYRGEKRVLDIGYANAEDRYLKGLLSLGIPQLYGLDRIMKEIDGMIPLIGDIRKTDFPDEFFDLIFCISTIEHVGRNNSIYFQAKDGIDDLGDFKAIEEMARIIRKNGKIVLTVPYGKFCDYGWFIQYDQKRLMNLIRSSNCKVVLQKYYIYNSGWRECHHEMLSKNLYQDSNAVAASGLACVLLGR